MGLKLWAGREERRRGMGGSWKTQVILWGSATCLLHQEAREATTRHGSYVLKPRCYSRSSGEELVGGCRGEAGVWAWYYRQTRGLRFSGQGPTERPRQD